MSETCSACALVWPCPTPGPADARGAVASNGPHRSRVSPDDPDHPSDMPCPLPRRIETGASVDCFPIPRGLPRITGGSASATYLSRPARASHALRPAGSLNRPRRPLSRGSNAASYPATSLASYQSNRQLSGWNLPPLVVRALGAHGKQVKVSRHICASTWLHAPPRMSLLDRSGVFLAAEQTMRFNLRGDPIRPLIDVKCGIRPTPARVV